MKITEAADELEQRGKIFKENDEFFELRFGFDLNDAVGCCRQRDQRLVGRRATLERVVELR